jgi:cell division protein FtsB
MSDLNLVVDMISKLNAEIAGLRAERDRQTEIIITLRQELKEAKARNTMYLSKIQEFEAREY